MDCTPVDLSGFFDLSAEGMRAPDGKPSPWHPLLPDRVQALGAGHLSLLGIPFALATDTGARWLQLSGDDPVTLPMRGRATYVIFAHFCNASVRAEDLAERPDLIPGYVIRPGEHLADYVLLYCDGSEHRQTIRRRFEVSEPSLGASHQSFTSRLGTSDRPTDMRGPYARDSWGKTQTSVVTGVSVHPAEYWIYALANPHPDQDLVGVRLEPSGRDRLAIGGVTLYHGRTHPLQRRRLQAFRLTVPPDQRTLPDGLDASIDMGVIARQYAVPTFSHERWLAEELRGCGEKAEPPQPASEFRLEITASPEATLTVLGRPVGMQAVYDEGIADSADGAVRIELLPDERTWVHVKVEDAATGQVTPARVHIRTPDGRYVPPYGHRHQVNDNWFEDYGADLKLGSVEYAYVDGRFQVELPVGEVFVEVSKGFEYEPLRQRVHIAPGQRELVLQMQRPFDLRTKGWITADTHVHFISPQTAWLEARAEGLNLVNLLASQWGDLFTNVGDLSGGMSGVSSADTMVWVGTENRQHIMGHINLLGGTGDPVYPMTTDGPGESYLGDPIESSMAEWADLCHEREGVVVIPHFPNPHLEVAADVILGKVDGVEIRYFSPTLDNYQMGEWYRFLNLGYRVAAVGGTDKMSAGMPVGGVRTYADLRGEEFTFANWGRAVRSGRTYTSSGPLIGLSVEGRAPGDEIRLPTGGGTLEVLAWADCVQPIHELQLVVNGRVVDRVVREKGSRRLEMRSRVRVTGSAWIAARCMSRLVVWHCWPINLAAHTSPVYVVAGQQEIFTPSDATFMLTLLEGGLAYLDTLSIAASPERHERIKSVFSQAHAEMHRRLHAH